MSYNTAISLREGKVSVFIEKNNYHKDNYVVYFQMWDIQKFMVPGQKLYSLPFDVVLNNNVALTYFIGEKKCNSCSTIPFFISM